MEMIKLIKWLKDLIEDEASDYCNMDAGGVSYSHIYKRVLKKIKEIQENGND